MQKSHLNNRNIALVPSPDYDAIKGAGDVRENILDLAKRVIRVLQVRAGFQAVGKDSEQEREG